VGDSFPLGILPDAEYQETRLELAPGDQVVLYTDGIVEAMNERQEMFGFDRLLQVARAGREMGADALLSKVMAEVGAFVGTGPQHDDLTVIVLSVKPTGPA
jgi:sigma-B regulation protein RsbU (phosphoserine phosphatase)